MARTRWVDFPTRWPAACAVSGSAERKDGPFLEGPELSYVIPGVPGRAPDQHRRAPLYLSAFSIREMLSHPDSPLVPVPRAEYESLLAERDAAMDRLAEAETEAVELREEIASVRRAREDAERAGVSGSERRAEIQDVVEEYVKRTERDERGRQPRRGRPPKGRPE